MDFFTFFNKTAMSKDVLKMSKDAIEKVFILTIPAWTPKLNKLQKIQIGDANLHFVI